MRIILAITAAGALAACTKAGMGPEVKMDVQARMESAAPTITACYQEALTLDRKLRGVMVVQFRATAKTGAFEQVQVVRDDLGDQVLQKCVVDAVGALKLQTPQSSHVAISYPLDFAPNQ